MNFTQVKVAAINSIQWFFDDQKLDLMVGEVSDDDYKILCGGYGDLEWPWALSDIGNAENSISFCFKITGGKIPDGIAMGLFDTENETLSIYMIESFVRQNNTHPLSGRMVYFTLVSSLLFLEAFDGKTLHFVDPLNQDLEGYYKSFGFSEPYSYDGENIQSISIDDLRKSITDYN
ncbi:hypothetical protein [Shewanella sp. 10N.286.48.B5]|uniref:hypothetical protein n=1 Tax=Shewanella sp. 10N.286.48.B5 TaxID=1880834 RepID=UPI000C858958|nr:hypothetical protein [Shewanella sp. 10N.286.48.B5]PMH85150.1 hypothetical protein BCU57_15735 [Shewanella sp. 10N.286.48.B5]